MLTDEGVHLLRGGSNDHPKNDQRGSNDSDISPAHQIGQAADKRAYRCQGKEVAKHEPDPPICTANVAVDDWGYLQNVRRKPSMFEGILQVELTPPKR